VPVDQVEEFVGTGPSPPEELMRRQELDQIRAAMATLSDREQRIIQLKFGGGLGNTEIAQVLSLRAGHVAVILFRAIRKIRAILDEEA
jgi:RNA polymerase sigma-70 factor (ECF subfamily)